MLGFLAWSEDPCLLYSYTLSHFVSVLDCYTFQDVDFGYLSRLTKGFSGADLTEICQRVSL